MNEELLVVLFDDTLIILLRSSNVHVTFRCETKCYLKLFKTLIAFQVFIKLCIKIISTFNSIFFPYCLLFLCFYF